jgi:hypothetical protein
MIHVAFGDATNASMHLREILKRFGLRYTWSYYANEYYYCITYMICRGLCIPFIYYIFWTCDSSGPFVLIFFPIHIVQNWYYVSQLPKLIKVRNTERAKLMKAKLTLKWFTPISSEDAKGAGIGNFEAYKM